MDRTRTAASFRTPGHWCIQRPIHLEHTGTVPIRPQPSAVARRHAVADYFQQLTRRDVEQDGACRGQRCQRFDRCVGQDLAAERSQVGGKRVHQLLRSAARDRPADAVGGDDQPEPVAGTCGELQRNGAVGRRAGEHSARPLVAKTGASQCVRRSDRHRREARHQQRVAKARGPEQSVHQVGRSIHERRHHAAIGPAVLAAQALRRGGYRTLHDDGSSVVERVRERCGRMHELVAELRQRQRLQKGRSGNERLNRRAHVVHETRLGERKRAGGAADSRLRLVDPDGASSTRERDRRRQAVGAGAYDDRIDCGRTGPADHRFCR